MAHANSPPKAPESAGSELDRRQIRANRVTVLSDHLLKRKATRTANSSRLYQLHKNKVMEGKRQPSKKPRRMRVTTRGPKEYTNPVQRHTIPQQKVMKVSDSMELKAFNQERRGKLGEDVEDIEDGYTGLLSNSELASRPA